MVAEGHIVANHTQSHTAAFTIGNRARVEEEIKRCSDAIYRVAGVRPLLFRPPFGVTTPLIGRAIKDMKLKVIGWSVRSYDTLHRRTRKSVVDGVMRKIHPGAIILLHDRCNNVDELLEMLIKEGTERGYRFVTLDEMLKIKVYED
jgi:peptidoglycan/xylan/chitin deacetylase (PgdA/CDA1 family)